MNKPMVSVVMITYGHDQFISQAIQGVLMQKCDFEIELIIANDCSPDNSDAVVKQIYKSHPKSHLINYTNHTENKGMMVNFIWALQQAKGKYIAVCEGDDYWTDSFKLQKQVDFLEMNDQFSLCGHNISECNEDVISSISNNKVDYLFNDFASSGSCSGIYTCSMLFRNTQSILRVIFAEWTLKLDGGDYLVLLLATLDGSKVRNLQDYMGTYRIHNGGIWSSSSVEKKVKDAIISNRLYIENLDLSKIQKYHVRYGLAPRIRQYYYAKIKNRYIRKTVSWLLKIILIMGPGSFSNRIIDFFSNRIISRI